MDVFGSREGDPLLQNDPLAPSDEENDDADPSASPTDASERPPSPSEQRDAGDDTVFDPASTRSSAAGGEGDGTRIVVRSAEAVAEGRLTELNTAFDQGWRLLRVDVESEEADSSSRQGLALTFVLREGHRAESAV